MNLTAPNDAAITRLYVVATTGLEAAVVALSSDEAAIRIACSNPGHCGCLMIVMLTITELAITVTSCNRNYNNNVSVFY